MVTDGTAPDGAQSVQSTLGARLDIGALTADTLQMTFWTKAKAVRVMLGTASQPEALGVHIVGASSKWELIGDTNTLSTDTIPTATDWFQTALVVTGVHSVTSDAGTTGALASVYYREDAGDAWTAVDGLQDIAWAFDAGGLAFKWLSLRMDGTNRFVDDINVSSEITIPEPASLGLLGAGSLMMLPSRRQSKGS